MTTLIKEENGNLIAEFKGRLDTAAAIQTTKDVEPLMLAENTNIILDCTDLEYISSSGLRIFIGILKNSKAKGGQVTVKNINEEISKVFQMTGFNKLFNII
ncbi:MAG: STAS domain-containing protein [Bacteroidales bacterium]|nr:STAS domain-containing protein [Bacteroidales bacterium]